MTESTSGWTRAQVHVVAASFLAWTLDAFDFFVMTFILRDIAAEFSVQLPTVAYAVLLTLALRPVGAFLFGRLADRYGRKPMLLLNILCYSLLGFSSGFAPDLTMFLVLRGLFGIAMGGEWGIGASLTMESIPARARGPVSGLLQCGYPAGYLLAAVVYATLYQSIGWRGMFMIGLVPAFALMLYVKFAVRESPAWHQNRGSQTGTFAVLRSHWRVALYAILMMTAFSFFSHGTQDLYPTFLQVQHKLMPATVGLLAIVANIGAISGSIGFGAVSQRIGRRRAIVLASILALPILPLWAYSQSLVWMAAGAFLIQFMVQGAYGVIPAYLNELSPPGARGTFPGTVFQLGNFLASANVNIQVFIAMRYGGDYRIALASVAVMSAIAIMVLVGYFGTERRDADLGASPAGQ